MLCAFGNDASCPVSTNTQQCCARGASPSFVNGFLQLSRYTAHLYTHRIWKLGAWWRGREVYMIYCCSCDAAQGLTALLPLCQAGVESLCISSLSVFLFKVIVEGKYYFTTAARKSPLRSQSSCISFWVLR